MSISTYHALLRDLCRSTLRAGFKEILIINAHGGNTAAVPALTTDLTQGRGAPIATTTLYALPHEKRAFAPMREDRDGVRALTH